MPTDRPEQDVTRKPEQEIERPGDRSAQRHEKGDKGSFGGDQPFREDEDDNSGPTRQPQRDPDQGSRDFEK